MIAKNLCVHACRVANNLTSKICSAPGLTRARRMDSARNVADWLRSPSGWVASAVVVMLSLTLALLGGCAGLVSGTSTTSTPPPGTLQVATTSLAVGSMGASYSATLQAAGGTSPYTWSTVSGQLPTGLSLSSSTGAISGTPSVAGSFAFGAQVKDSKAATASSNLSINISTTPAPAITTVSPNTGSPAGGDTITISGSNFLSGATVEFGSSAAMSVQVSSATQIQAVTPAESAGLVNVTVQNSDGQVATAVNAYLFGTSTTGPILPAPPQATVNATFPNTTGYTVTNVTPGQLQAAINNASCNPNGTVLQLPKGDVETGGFTLPLKTCASGQWIIITTAGVTLPAQGTRLDPSLYVGQLARLTTAVPVAVVATVANVAVNSYWLSGLELEQAAVAASNEAVDIGYASATPSQLPSNIVIDRCYIHGKASNQVSRLVNLNENNVAVVDSYLSEGHAIGFDAQGILTVSGGPMLIQNNFIEGAGENIMFGGASNGSSQPPYNNFSNDVTIRKNFIYKPVAWYVQNPAYMGIRYTVKNLYEMKEGNRVLVQNNVLENNWGDAQAGEVALFQALIQSGLNSVINDVAFTYNYAAHAAEGFVIAGNDPTLTPIDTTKRLHRLLIQNNLLDDINAPVWQGTYIGRFGYYLTGAPDAVTIDHNTIPFQAPPNLFVLFSDDTRATSFYFTNNLNYAPGGTGIAADGTAEGTPTIQAWLSGPPAGSVTQDILIGANCSKYPSSFSCPATASAVGFANYNNGNGGDYTLCTGAGAPSASCAGASPYAAGQSKACQANTNCGADVAGLNNGIAGVAVFPANPPQLTSLSATSMVCNGTNALTINGSNLNLPGIEVLIKGVVAPPQSLTATAITLVPPAATAITVPVTVDNFGLPITASLACQ